MLHTSRPEIKATSAATIAHHPPGITPQGSGGSFFQIPQGYKDHIAEFTQAFPDAHIVLCGYDGKRKAAYPGWRTPAPHSAACRHAGSALVGLIPASIGLTVVDVDQGNPLALALGLMPEYITLSGTPGRGHLWFEDDQSRGNWDWEYTAKDSATFSGEIRGGNGYICLWEPWVIYEAIRFPLLTDLSRTFGEVETWLKPKVVDLPPARAPSPGPHRPSHALERAITIITDIPPDSYDTWITVGQCLEGSARKGDFPNDSAFTLWRNWSARSPDKFPGERAMWNKWASFKGGTARTLGSLVAGRTA